jgi:hypothetical protein
MGLDNLRQDIRHAVRSLLRAPGFAVVTILTLALGIGANTAIFSIVNGVILRPLAYPKPEQLMYLTTQFPAFGFDQFWVSPPEYFEFREINQSFSAVGAFTTGEVNLTAGDRPLRVRSASVDDGLLAALGVPPVAGRLYHKGETDIIGPPPTPGTPPVPLPPYVILSHQLWQNAFGGRDMIGQKVEVNGLPREVIGVMPPGADVMDNRTEIWMPLGLNPGNRQNRGNHFLYLIGRLKERARGRQAARVRSPSCHRGGAQGQPGRRPSAADDAGATATDRRRHACDLGPAGRGRVRVADRLRQPRQPAVSTGGNASP